MRPRTRKCDETQRDAVVRGVEEIGLYDNGWARFAGVGATRGDYHDGAAGHFQPVVSATFVMKSSVSRSERCRLASID